MNEHFRILAIDGGGIRGVLPARWLLALNGALSPGGSVARQFDLLAGTSTGAILALALACEIPVTEVIRLYKDKGLTIFPARAQRWWNRLGRVLSQGVSAPKYGVEGIERTLQQVFGDRTLGELKHRVLVVAYDTFTRAPFVMRSWDTYFAEIPVWQAARASSAAPTYFPALVVNIGSVLHPLVDGGVVANNPAGCALAASTRLNPQRVPVTMVSMGTGRAVKPITAHQALTWGALQWAPRILDVLLDASEAVHYQMQQALQAPHVYCRFQTTLAPQYEAMDAGEPEHVQELDALADGYLRADGFRLFQDTVKALS